MKCVAKLTIVVLIAFLVVTHTSQRAYALILDAPQYKYQLEPYSKWQERGLAGHNNNCGPAVNAMVIEKFLGINLSTAIDSSPSYAQEINCLTEARWKYSEFNGLEGGYRNTFADTTGANIMIMVLHHVGLQAEYVDGSDVTLQRIEKAIDRNSLVICHVDVEQYYPHDPAKNQRRRARSHYVLAYGYTSESIVIHDPGYRALHHYHVPRAHFFNALQKAHYGSSQQLIIVSKPTKEPVFTYTFPAHRTHGWHPGRTDSWDVPQNQDNRNSLMIRVNGTNPSFDSPLFPKVYSTKELTTMVLSARVESGDGNLPAGQSSVYVRDSNGIWHFTPVHRVDNMSSYFAPRDYDYHEYAVDLTALGDIGITQVSIHLTRDTYQAENWIFDWVQFHGKCDQELPPVPFDPGVTIGIGGGGDPNPPDPPTPVPTATPTPQLGVIDNGESVIVKRGEYTIEIYQADFGNHVVGTSSEAVESIRVTVGSKVGWRGWGGCSVEAWMDGDGTGDFEILNPGPHRIQFDQRNPERGRVDFHIAFTPTKTGTNLRQVRLHFFDFDHDIRGPGDEFFNLKGHGVAPPATPTPTERAPTKTPTPTVTPTAMRQAESAWYAYDGTAYTGHGPVRGGEQDNWSYWLTDRANVFTAGETAYGIVKLLDVQRDFQVRTVSYRNGVPQYTYDGAWQDVGAWGWSKAYHWARWDNVQPGACRIAVYVRGSGSDTWQHVDDLAFTVEAAPTAPTPTPLPTVTQQAYAYDGNGYTGYGPLTGGADTSWHYALREVQNVFAAGDTVYGLVRIDTLPHDFRMRTVTYCNGTQLYDYRGDWQDVGAWGWNYAYHPAYWSNVWPGAWEFHVYLDSGSGWQLVDVLPFTVQ